MKHGIKIPNMINLASTSLSISSMLDNKPKQEYDLFYKLALSVVEACDVDKTKHIFLIRAN